MNHCLFLDCAGMENWQWEDVVPEKMRITQVEGDRMTGPSTYALELAAGFAFPVHRHTHDYNAIVCKGQHKHWHQGKEGEATVMNVGDTWFTAGGETTWHADSNPGLESSIVLVKMKGVSDAIYPGNYTQIQTYMSCLDGVFKLIATTSSYT